MKRKLHILIATIVCLTMGNQLSAQTEVIYDFNSGLVGLNTFANNTTPPTITGGIPAVGPTSTLTPPRVISDNGIPNTTGVLRYNPTSTVKSNSIVSDLTDFPASQDYSVTWKQYVTTAENLRIVTGFVLRANPFPSTPSSGGSAHGIKRGYLAVVERMDGVDLGKIRFRLFETIDGAGDHITVAGANSAVSPIFLNTGSSPMAINTAYWFRLSISGTTTTTIRLEYSLDGVTYTNHSSFSFAAGSRPMSGTTQLFSGFNQVFPSGSPSPTAWGYSSWFMDDITFNNPPTSATTWLGNTWSNGGPTATTRATIAANYSTARDIVASSLIVKSPAVATIPSGNFINSAGAVTVENGASLTLENNAKLIQTSDSANSGNISVKRNSFDIVRFDYTLWSSPVSGQNLFTFSPNTVIDPIVRFYNYNTASNQYDNAGITANSSFVTGKGYAVRAPNGFSETTPTSFTGTFTGVPNNGSLTVGLDATSPGFNLVGNPYPSPIDADAFIDANSSLINGALYFYSHNAKSNGTSYEPLAGTGLQYATYTKTGAAAAVSSPAGVGSLGQNNNAPNGTIQVGQGFIVKANNNGSLSFTNAMRRVTGGTANADQFFKVNSSSKAATSATAPDRHRLWLDLKTDKGEGLSQLLVGYVAGATNNVDNLFDGEEFGNAKTSLSSLLNGKNYTIQGRALPFNDSDVVPLAFKAASNGIFTIGIAKTDGIFDTNQEILLKDNTTGKLTNLKTGSYTFSATAGTANSRFELMYSKSALNLAGLEDGVGAVIAVKKQGVYQISTTGAVLNHIVVYDIQGNEILKMNNINSSSTLLSELPATKGVFIVKVTTDTDKTQIIKIIN